MQTKIKVVMKPVEELQVYDNNPRDHSETVGVVTQSIKDFGFLVPILIDKNNVIIDGEAQLKAAIENSYTEVPCIVADELTADEVKAVRLVINRTQDFTKWTFEQLTAELEAVNIDLSAYRFPDLSDMNLDVSDSDFLHDEEIAREQEARTVICPHCGQEFEI